MDRRGAGPEGDQGHGAGYPQPFGHEGNQQRVYLFKQTTVRRVSDSPKKDR